MVYLISCRSLLQHTISVRAWIENPYVLIAIGVLSLLQLLLTNLSFMQLLFGTTSINYHDWLLIICACLIIYLLMELEKWLS